MQPWEISLFGGLRLVRDGVEHRLKRRKAAALLSLLAYRAQPQNRETLLDMLWPAEHSNAARNRFNVVLSSLRGVLEPSGVVADSVLFTDHNTIQLRPKTFQTDVAQFEELLKAASATQGETHIAHLLAATRLYRGALLSGFYEDWIAFEEMHLENLYCQAICRIVEYFEGNQKAAWALQHAQRGAALCPLREELHQHVIRLHMSADQPVLARRHYRDLERIFHRKLNVAPSPQTFELLRRRPRARVTAAKKSAAPSCEYSHDKNDAFPAQVETQEKPAAASQRCAAHFLPPQWTRFFGREEEIAQLHRAFVEEKTRLVVLTGSGGIGKTRLALEVARAVERDWPRAVFFVALGDQREAASLAETVLAALDVRRESSASALQQVTQFLAVQPSLLVLDSFEKLVPQGAAFIASLLEAAPQLSLMVTSQRDIGCDGAREFALLPLPIPQMEKTPESWRQCASVQLFCDRAWSANPHFALSGHNAHAVASLCVQFEGVPLALELAAARVNVLAPAQIALGLEKSLKQSRRQTSSHAPRHQTLSAILQWSYDLIAPEIQPFFAQLGVFRGRFSGEAAQAVTQEPGALHRLAQLRACSLLRCEEQHGVMYFRLLDTVRDFAQNQLSPAQTAKLQRLHAAHFATLAAKASAATLANLQAESANVQAALEFLLVFDATTALRMATDLAAFWEASGKVETGGHFLRAALDASLDGEPSLRCDAKNALGQLLFSLGNFEEAERCYRASHDAAARCEYSRGVAEALLGQGIIAVYANRVEDAEAHLQEALASCRHTNYQAGAAKAQLYLGIAAAAAARFEVSGKFLRQSLRFWRTSQDSDNLAMCLFFLGDNDGLAGKRARALAALNECLAIAIFTGNTKLQIHALWGLGNEARRFGRYDAARLHYEKAAEMLLASSHYWGVPFLLEVFGYLCVDENRMECAATLLGAAQKLRQSMGMPLSPAYQPEQNAYRERLCMACDEKAVEKSWRKGGALEAEAALRLALKSA